VNGYLAPCSRVNAREGRGDGKSAASTTALNSLGNFVGNTVSCGNRHGENAPFGPRRAGDGGPGAPGYELRVECREQPLLARFVQQFGGGKNGNTEAQRAPRKAPLWSPCLCVSIVSVSPNSLASSRESRFVVQIGTAKTHHRRSLCRVSALCFNRFGSAKQSGVITRIAVCCANRHSENPPLPQFVQSQRCSTNPRRLSQTAGINPAARCRQVARRANRLCLALIDAVFAGRCAVCQMAQSSPTWPRDSGNGR